MSDHVSTFSPQVNIQGERANGPETLTPAEWAMFFGLWVWDEVMAKKAIKLRAPDHPPVPNFQSRVTACRKALEDTVLTPEMLLHLSGGANHHLQPVAGGGDSRTFADIQSSSNVLFQAQALPPAAQFYGTVCTCTAHPLTEYHSCRTGQLGFHR